MTKKKKENLKLIIPDEILTDSDEEVFLEEETETENVQRLPNADALPLVYLLSFLGALVVAVVLCFLTILSAFLAAIQLFRNSDENRALGTASIAFLNALMLSFGMAVGLVNRSLGNKFYASYCKARAWVERKFSGSEG